MREVITRIEERNETFWRLNVDAYLAKNTEQRIYGRISLHVDAIPYGVTILDVVPNAHGEMVWSGFIDFNKVFFSTYNIYILVFFSLKLIPVFCLKMCA